MSKCSDSEYDVYHLRKIEAAVSHHETEAAELRADRELAVEYLKAAMESLDDPNDSLAERVQNHLQSVGDTSQY